MTDNNTITPNPIPDPQHEEVLSPEVVEAMGISQAAFEEVQNIVGCMPTVQELSTLLAMWEANGRQQSLYGWLKGQHHLVERHEYLYDGDSEVHKGIKEPRVKDCIALAHEVVAQLPPTDVGDCFARGENLYMVGNVSTEFLDSEYARRCLHIVADPVKMTTVEEDVEYMELILGSLKEAEVISLMRPVGAGGLFVALVRCCCHNIGFDILTCREVRLDAFLFGEERGRYIVSLKESHDDFFLTKMDEARLNCCFLGRVTRGRILVDDMDFGPSTRYMRK